MWNGKEERIMYKIVHDKRPYYNKITDLEWDKAIESNEKEQYYWVRMFNGGICIKKYKPSIAKLIKRRTGLVIELWKGEQE